MEYNANKQAKQCESLLKLLNHQKFADTTFIIGSNQDEYKVNRLFLAAISPVFEAMLYGKMRESALDSDVIIKDIEPPIFESIINFAYCSDPKISENTVIDVYTVADKYQIGTLMDWCDEYFRSHLSETNVCGFLKQSVTLLQTKITQQCIDFIEDKSVNVLEILESGAFVNMNVMSMRAFLKSSVMIDEDTLWEYVLEWAECQTMPDDDINVDTEQIEQKTESTKLSLLKAVYDLLRFGLMDGKFFCENVMSTNVLSKDEIITVLAYYQNQKAGCGEFRTTSRLNNACDTTEKCLIPNELVMSSRFRKGSNTIIALTSENLAETCTTEKESGEKYIECKFATGVHIHRIDIGPAMIANKRENTVYGAKFLDNATLCYLNEFGEWNDLKNLGDFEEGKIKSIPLDLKVHAISVDSERDNSHLSVGCLRIFGSELSNP